MKNLVNEITLSCAFLKVIPEKSERRLHRLTKEAARYLLATERMFQISDIFEIRFIV